MAITTPQAHNISIKSCSKRFKKKKKVVAKEILMEIKTTGRLIKHHLLGVDINFNKIMFI